MCRARDGAPAPCEAPNEVSPLGDTILRSRGVSPIPTNSRARVLHACARSTTLECLRTKDAERMHLSCSLPCYECVGKPYCIRLRITARTSYVQ